ncbi:hypothetical protein CgunFtcFv8_012405 [Champsocephalus gunnari]|uniref:AT-rich interactive domain-containing protein 4B n=1 Tax=Champsocephalus gunnari TaxID=52237 RepID=A0AAN8D8N0_CHAGU|nr:hypothetical protein CgunFtcFv8_012405 [Champsocephalus gunnari]
MKSPPDDPPPPVEETLSPPRPKSRRSLLSETPPRLSLSSSPLKRQEEPMVVLHILPSQRLPPDSPTSDTDSASEEEEEEEEGGEERSSPLKRKAGEQRGGDKKLRPDRTISSPKLLPSPVKEEAPPPSSPLKEEALPPSSPPEELLGPEALLCHEVDLDDPEEREKPEHLLLMMREAEHKDRGQKRVTDSLTLSPTAKKQKRSQKRLSTPGKNGAGQSSDSEDLSQTSRCLSSPRKEKHSFCPQRASRWTFQIEDLERLSGSERISFLQEKLQDIRKYYLTLKSEVASIDRRRKRLKKKEREVSNTTPSTSSGSSDAAMSPSSASPTQNTVAVECR